MNICYRYLSLIALSCISLAVHAMEHLGQQLIEATRGGDIQEVQDLISKGANINAQDQYGRTALMLALVNYHLNIAKLLLQHSSDVTLKDQWGDTALDIIKAKFNSPYISQKAKAKYKEIGQMLLEAYIEQKKQQGSQAAAARALKQPEIQEKMKAELREKMKGLPEDVIKYAEQFLRP